MIIWQSFSPCRIIKSLLELVARTISASTTADFPQLLGPTSTVKPSAGSMTVSLWAMKLWSAMRRIVHQPQCGVFHSGTSDGRIVMNSAETRAEIYRGAGGKVYHGAPWVWP